MSRVALSRLTPAISRRIEVVRHRGGRVFCPICGHSFACFKDARHRPNALCWRCGSHERQRAQWLLFDRRPGLLSQARSLLHFAPEWALQHRLERLEQMRYVTADLLKPDVDLHLDLAALDLPDASFEAVICSHVLEHVPDDAAGMRELRRVTTADGWCLVMVPLDLTRERTYEDSTLTEPEERLRAFGQADHVRFYGRDITDRLRGAGFVVEVIEPRVEFGEALIERCRIPTEDHMFLCRPGNASVSRTSA